MASKKSPVVNDDATQNAKSILLSKTFWVNIVMIICFIAQNKWGYIIDENTQIQALGVINIILRLTTKEPVRWK